MFSRHITSLPHVIRQTMGCIKQTMSNSLTTTITTTMETRGPSTFLHHLCHKKVFRLVTVGAGLGSHGMGSTHAWGLEATGTPHISHI